MEVNETPEILQAKMKVEGINNVIILNDSDYDRIETKFPNDLIIEARLKDDGEIKNAVVEIIDTKSGKTVQKKELKKDEKTGKLTTGDAGHVDTTDLAFIEKYGDNYNLMLRIRIYFKLF